MDIYNLSKRFDECTELNLERHRIGVSPLII
jgi:hypothetical protein